MNKTSEELRAAFGYQTVHELMALKVLAKNAAHSSEDNKPIIVNIGAGPGTSGLAFREACPDALIYTIDNCLDSPFGGMKGEKVAFEEAEKQLPIQVFGDSSTIGLEWDGDSDQVSRTIELLLVDGDHSMEGLTKDVEAWIPHVAKDGVVAFHDYGNFRCPDVKMFIDAYIFGNRKKYTFLFQVDTLIVFRVR